MTIEESDAPDRANHLRSPSVSALDEFTVYEIGDDVTKEVDPVEEKVLPMSTLVVVAETSQVKEHLDQNIDEFDFHEDGTFKVSNWSGKRFYSDYIKAGIEYKKKTNPDYDPKVVMLFESPSSSTNQSSFHNAGKFRFHDWPPPKQTKSKGILGPNRYASMNGPSYPVFLKDGGPPEGLMNHWKEAIPGFVEPSFVPKIDTEEDTAYAYLPVEQLKHHINDPDTHYHLAGKDAIHLMTQKTTKILPDTRHKRPCVVKTTHSMGSKGIFIINDDEDEKEFQQFLVDSGNPNYVVVDFVDIARNIACHFFMHPNGSIVWFGSNENHREPDGKFSSDSFLMMEHQDTLKEMQLPFVEEVVRYCRGMGFWGFCGVDVLFNSSGEGYLVDINPRVTGSCPALMALSQLQRAHGFTVGLFRRSGSINFFGTSKQLMSKVSKYNKENAGKSSVIIHSMWEVEDVDGTKPGFTKVNIGVYGNDLAECKAVLNTYAKPLKSQADEIDDFES
mmetsp:Transcript_4162/g.5455  ORF Transcript_4162/g.5455 Transcript_4162/m.5455 type:complete len:502 (-) Transcript_4162:87-1592(-)|eukprot:CAMPEP_0198143610 /NCGR_PEP_ID=MMETSP1443-20131203/8566_1 /TAXON_ID=186043 /ORGANISM="Entomoneis sp., Strain CCMP2396" /LENGTH=501 /DNA_ID=CAMNT_0043806873 /DNA_START=71 /DNA_END=1576 /DNA_ORIENTATION=+